MTSVKARALWRRRTFGVATSVRQVFRRLRKTGGQVHVAEVNRLGGSEYGSVCVSLFALDKSTKATKLGTVLDHLGLSGYHATLFLVV